jgi:hypothetical protein
MSDDLFASANTIWPDAGDADTLGGSLAHGDHGDWLLDHHDLPVDPSGLAPGHPHAADAGQLAAKSAAHGDAHDKVHVAGGYDPSSAVPGDTGGAVAWGGDLFPIDSSGLTGDHLAADHGSAASKVPLGSGPAPSDPSDESKLPASHGVADLKVPASMLDNIVPPGWGTGSKLHVVDPGEGNRHSGTDGRADQPGDVRELLRNLPQFDREPLRTDMADRVNQLLDVEGALFGSLTLFIESWGAELTGLTLGIASPLLGLGVAVLRGDDLAEWNGKIQGFANAIEDMSHAYADPTLHRQPLNSWPPLPRPQARQSADYAHHTSVLAFRQGERAGAELAYQWVRQYHDTVTVRGQDGQMHRVQSNPYLFLRGLASHYPGRGEAARALREELNRQIRARGDQTWPRIR